MSEIDENVQLRFRPSPLVMAASRILLLLAACASLIIAYKYETLLLAELGSTYVSYFLYASGLIAIIFVIPNRYWRNWTFLLATTDGLLFPSDIPFKSVGNWLPVPWNKVGAIAIYSYNKYSTGLSVEIDISERDRKKYFSHLKWNVKTHTSENLKYIKVFYSVNNLHMNKIVDRLKELKHPTACRLSQDI